MHSKIWLLEIHRRLEDRLWRPLGTPRNTLTINDFQQACHIGKMYNKSSRCPSRLDGRHFIVKQWKFL